MINAFLIYSFEDLEFRTTFWVTLRNAQMLVVTLSATGIVALKIHVPSKDVKFIAILYHTMLYLG